MQNREERLLKYVRIPPRKARLAADLIRGLSVEDASDSAHVFTAQRWKTFEENSR
jgi:ribosomal protein L22